MGQCASTPQRRAAAFAAEEERLRHVVLHAVENAPRSKLFARVKGDALRVARVAPSGCETVGDGADGAVVWLPMRLPLSVHDATAAVEARASVRAEAEAKLVARLEATFDALWREETFTSAVLHAVWSRAERATVPFPPSVCEGVLAADATCRAAGVSLNAVATRAFESVMARTAFVADAAELLRHSVRGACPALVCFRNVRVRASDEPARGASAPAPEAAS
jgi:hypothetical protein